jgi:hypothetical protein
MISRLAFPLSGEAIVCDENGLAVFELIRRHGALAVRRGNGVVL